MLPSLNMIQQQANFCRGRRQLIANMQQLASCGDNSRLHAHWQLRGRRSSMAGASVRAKWLRDGARGSATWVATAVSLPHDV
eukprot:scaffold305752_cov30-Tisochrysis_lutea.AAC.6